jgi:WLM domain
MEYVPIFIMVFAVLIYIVSVNIQPQMLSELKYKYWILLDILKKTGDPLWDPVRKPAIITGMLNWDKTKGPIGSNVNKGYEIYICLDGTDVNSAMYILLHELAHMSVPEYDHTRNFWEHFEKLKKIAIDAGVYTLGGNRTYCGDTVKD